MIQLQNIFQQRYGIPPTHYSCAPGRVNLIGEHIDYMGYGVLPFALQQSCTILFARDGNQIEVQHIDEAQFPAQIIQFNEEPKTNHMKYFMAGYKAAFHFNKKDNGIKVLISGNVPFSSGLSSSSALVVASAFANIQVEVDKNQFLEEIIKCERAAGTACGGMDQTISIFGKEGQATFIEFDPLKLFQVILPEGYSFIVANSLTPSTKLESLGKHYNKRVCECRLAIKLLGSDVRTFKQLQQKLNLSLNGLQKVIELIPKGELDIKQFDLHQWLHDIPHYQMVLEQNETFNPYNRAKHVVEEANRVLRFKEICDSALNNQDKAILLGQLMNESQESCRGLYECSSIKIDELVQICRENGALGSRLTGAGWGGCTVSLIERGKAEEFIEKVCKSFYGGVKDQNIIFQTKPSNGAFCKSI